MPRIHTLDIELVRPGPPHNQLLSPMMPYSVLVGGKPPLTHQFQMEHRLLRHHLAALQRAAEGEQVRLLASRSALQDLIGGLLGRVGLPTIPGDDWLELRFVINPRELGVVPLELAVDTATPGSPPLLVDPARRVIITRKVRQGIADDYTPARSPRILYVVSAAGGPVPAQAHLHALRTAMDGILPPRPHTTLPRVGETLRILTNASLAAIRDTMRSGRYTHVHILAHGRAMDTDQGPSFGVVLDSSPNARGQRVEVVSGEKLAEALGASGRPPAFATVCTCESGRVVDVVEPSGSLGHALHRGKIPFVVVSQFPLEHRASVTFTHRFYSSLLPGGDPRLALNEARRAVYSGGGARFDWASLAAYSNLPVNLEGGLPKLRQDRRELAWSTALMWADEVLCRVDREGRGCWEQPKHDKDGAPIGQEPCSTVVARVEDRLTRVIAALRAELDAPRENPSTSPASHLEHERILERSDLAREAIRTLQGNVWRARLNTLLGDVHLRLSELLATTEEPRPNARGAGVVARQTQALDHRIRARDAYAASQETPILASAWGRIQHTILADLPTDASTPILQGIPGVWGTPLVSAKANLAAGLHLALAGHGCPPLCCAIHAVLEPNQFDRGDLQELWWVVDRTLRRREVDHQPTHAPGVPWWEPGGLDDDTLYQLNDAWTDLLRLVQRVAPRPHHHTPIQANAMSSTSQ